MSLTRRPRGGGSLLLPAPARLHRHGMGGLLARLMGLPADPRSGEIGSGRALAFVLGSAPP